MAKAKNTSKSATTRKQTKAKKPAYVFHVGDRILALPVASAPGTIIRIAGNNAVVKLDEGAISQVEISLKMLEPISPELQNDLEDIARMNNAMEERRLKMQQEKRSAEQQPTQRVPAEIDLHKYSYEKAFDRTTEYVEQELLVGMEAIKIIHGHGTGQVRRAVEQALKQHPRVSGFMTVPSQAAITANLK